jgi:serine/threonine protein kinase
MYEVYQKAEAFPQTETAAELQRHFPSPLKLNGYHLNNENLIIAYSELATFIIKVLKPAEIPGYRLVSNAVSATPSKALCSFNMVPTSASSSSASSSASSSTSSSNKDFAVMPFYTSTLEPVPTPLPSTATQRMFDQMLDALDFLHERKLAHMDVKPSNIFLHGDSCFLGDFGSVVPFGTRTSSTLAYIPRDKQSQTHTYVAAAAHDYYMLAMTLKEKALGSECGTRASEPTSDELFAVLKAHSGTKEMAEVLERRILSSSSSSSVSSSSCEAAASSTASSSAASSSSSSTEKKQ